MKELLITALLVFCAHPALADSSVSAAFVRSNEIFVSIDGAEGIQLTRSGIPKDFPVWSQNGSMIAFVEETSEETALARLVVISPRGRPLYDFLIHPVDPDGQVIGMRYVERIEWVTNSKIAVSGSINPSTAETIVFDLPTRGIDRSLLSDGYPAFSPDGRHVAYIGLVPHFTPATERKPALYVDDDQRVFPPLGMRVDFLTPPVWSQNGRGLAIVAMTAYTETAHVVSWRPGNKEPLSVPVPIEKEKGRHPVTRLFWNDDSLSILSGRAWSLKDGELEDRDPSQVVSPTQAAWNLRKNLETFLGADAAQSDFWCSSCPLSALPRRSTAGNPGVR